MIITFEDRDWDLNLSKYSYKQAMAIQLHTGLSISEYLDILDVDEDDDGNLKDPGKRYLECVGVMYWLMHQQGGDVFPLEFMDFDFTGFMAAVSSAMQAAAAARKAAAEEAEPDPTQPASLPGDPPSLTPASPTATTRTHHDREEDAIAS